VETRLGGQWGKLSLGASVETELGGQCGNWAWGIV